MWIETVKSSISKRRNRGSSQKAGRLFYDMAILVLLLYPLRHCNIGIDLWDAGYNYANFRFPGPQYMDEMWFYATWLANLLGSVLMKLPMGSTMLGMNLYTGLLVSTMAVVSFVLLTRKLKFSAWAVFVGVLMAVSLCWAPTAILYNYLTYFLLFGGTILLYCGLEKDQAAFLVLAGVCLGLNVAVRFSNLTQASFILAVWGYGLVKRKSVKKVCQETGFCILGYAGVFVVYFVIMGLLYGFGNYVQGISQLFAMTETATDYAPLSMLEAVWHTYYENTYWLKRLTLVGASGWLICFIVPRKWVKTKKVLVVLLGVIGGWWLFQKGLGYRDYAVYQAIFDPCVLVFTLMILFCCYRLVEKKSGASEKLQILLVMITLIMTSFGSNNAVYSAINNLFLVLPWFLGRFLQWMREEKRMWFLPLQTMMAVALCILAIQSLHFGNTFIYEEATGLRGNRQTVEGVPVLKGMQTTEEKAEALEGLHEKLQECQAEGESTTCLLFGQLPGLAYYMNLEPAMNIWSDLRSYTYERMEKDLSLLEMRIHGGEKPPVFLLEASLLSSLEEVQTELFAEPTAAKKMALLVEFAQKWKYQVTYVNEEFAILESAEFTVPGRP